MTRRTIKPRDFGYMRNTRWSNIQLAGAPAQTLIAAASPNRVAIRIGVLDHTPTGTVADGRIFVSPGPMFPDPLIAAAIATGITIASIIYRTVGAGPDTFDYWHQPLHWTKDADGDAVTGEWYASYVDWFNVKLWIAETLLVPNIREE